jgi:Uncharacterized conserved protein
MTKAQLVEAPRPYPGIKQAKIATARAHAGVTSPAMVQISLIREGAPAEIFAQTAKNIGLAQAELAKKLGLSPRTMASRRTRLTSEETEKTLRARYLFEQAVAVFGSEEEAGAGSQIPLTASKTSGPSIFWTPSLAPCGFGIISGQSNAVITGDSLPIRI